MEPSFEIIDEWCCIFLPDRSAPVRWIATNGSFDLVQRRDAFQSFFSNTRALGNMDVKELAADMGETGDFLDIATPIVTSAAVCGAAKLLRQFGRYWPKGEEPVSSAYGGVADGFERCATAPYDPQWKSA